MEIIELLSPERTQSCASGLSKKRALELICEIAAEQCSELPSHELFDSLLTREKMGSTGIGNGIALPHGRLSKLEQPIAVLLKCDEPIPFDAIDSKPVDLFFALFVPESEHQQHLSTLAKVAEKLSDKAICRALRKAEDSESLYEVIVS